MKIFIEDTAGEKFTVDVEPNDQLGDLASSFLHHKNVQYTDNQRVVMEIADPQNPDRTRRLGSDMTIEEAGLDDGMILRIFPEAIAGAVNEQERLERLIRDHKKMKELAKWHPNIDFEANMTHAPTIYKVTISHRGFQAIAKDGRTPIHRDQHRVKITLGAEYPWKPPRVEWQTPIFHPNIDKASGAVCLGILMDQYPPKMNLARLVTMLSEMVIYQNFDMTNALNGDAAKWSIDPKNWDYIRAIGGSPFQGPLAEILDLIKAKKEPRQFVFNPVSKGS